MRHFQSLSVIDVRRETEDCVSLAFAHPAGQAETFAFIQGQYLTLKAMINGEEVRRSYSICSGINDGELRVAIKEVPGGKFSTYANRELKVGDTLEVMPPMGRFYAELDPNSERKYVAFAAGSGITPMLSIIKSTLETEPKSVFTLFYVNKTSSSIIFKAALEDLKDRYMSRFRLFHLLTREPGDIELLSGRIDEERCEALCKTFVEVEDTDHFFVCGPEAMIHAVRDTLKTKGIADEKVHFELFTTPSEAGKAKEGSTKVVAQDTTTSSDKARVGIVLDGQQMDFELGYQGDSILDAALARGADLPFSCKGGVCCTCRALLVEGEVEMEVNYSLEPDELERGYILTCQAHPRSERIVVDFDQQ